MNMTTTKRSRGRPRKLKLSDEDMLMDIIEKAYFADFNEKDGKVYLTRNNTPLTLAETSFMIWNNEGRKTKKPHSNMAILKIEQAALNKLRVGLAKYGIKNLDDVVDPKYRTNATPKISSE